MGRTMEFESLAAQLRARKENLLRRWCDRVRNEHPGAQREQLEGRELLDHLPSLYDRLVQCLCEQDSPGLEHEGEEHGAQRRAHGYSVAEILDEIRIFRHELMFEMEDLQHSDRVLSPLQWSQARLRMIDLIDRSASTSVDRYARDTGRERDEAYAELQRHNIRLIAADARKDRFLTILSHELRNPLAAIVTATDMLELIGPDNSIISRSRGIIQRQAKHLVQLVDELLDVGRIAYGKIELRRQIVPFQDSVQLVVESTRPSIEGNQVSLQVEMPSQPLPVHADPRRLTQIVLNLVGNAQKFTPAGGQIHIRLSEENGQAVLRVRDTGIGISAEMLPKIFDLFTQADTSMRRQSGGLGIGLTLAKSLVEMHNGHITARSDGLGHGAELEVALPICR